MFLLYSLIYFFQFNIALIIEFQFLLFNHFLIFFYQITKKNISFCNSEFVFLFRLFYYFYDIINNFFYEILNEIMK